jgi:hypothetical protein
MNATLETGAKNQGQQGGVSAQTAAAVAALNATAIAMHRAINDFCALQPIGGPAMLGTYALAIELAEDFRGISVENAIRIVDLDIEMRQRGAFGPEMYDPALVDAWATDAEARQTLGARLVQLAGYVERA